MYLSNFHNLNRDAKLLLYGDLGHCYASIELLRMLNAKRALTTGFWLQFIKIFSKPKEYILY